MDTEDPVTQKGIGKPIFVDGWNKLAPEVMMNGLRAKFTQNSKLRKCLVSTKDYLIAECSPTDLTWGIGLPLESPEKSDTTKWRGRNQLGRLLCDLRDELKAPATE